MARRWLIRSPFLLAFFLVVAIWVASHFRSLYLDQAPTARYWCCYAVQGLFVVDIENRYPQPVRPLAFDFSKKYGAKDLIPVPTTLGFYAGTWRGQPDTLLIIFPLWAPALVLAALCWFFWRLTKPRPPGFPVELPKTPPAPNP
jgi:hypothetical protein